MASTRCSASMYARPLDRTSHAARIKAAAPAMNTALSRSSGATRMPVARREEWTHAIKQPPRQQRRTSRMSGSVAPLPPTLMHARTLYDKLWDGHVVRQEDDGTTLLYIDRHLVHEVTSPQAFEG